MKYPILIVLAGLSLLACQHKSTVESIVNNFEKGRNATESLQYRMLYKMKYFSAEDDTLKFDAHVLMVKDTADTLFGGSFWIKYDSTDRYFDQEHIYIIDHSNKIITRYFALEGQDWAVRGNTISGVIDSYYLRPNRLSNYLKDSTIKAILSDTLFNGQSFHKISFHFPDELPIEQQYKDFYFDENDQLKQIIYSVKFQNKFQYNEWHFSEEKFNNVSKEEMRQDFEALLKDDYKLEDFKEEPKEMKMPLTNGEIAPDFKGELLSTSDSVALSDHRGKIVVLDFWYKDCFPCIKAIPSIRAIREKYSAKELLVWGINPIDNNEQTRKKLPEFIEINRMNYPTVFVEKEVQRMYNVRGFPTFYILDQEGKVAYSKIGYSEESEHQIDSVLQLYLNKQTLIELN